MSADVILDVKVIPRAARTALAGTRNRTLLIRLAAAPVDGAANAALVEFLAKRRRASTQHRDRKRRNLTAKACKNHWSHCP